MATNGSDLSPNGEIAESYIRRGSLKDMLMVPRDASRPKSPGVAKMSTFQKKKIDYMFDTLYGPTDGDTVSREDFWKLLKTASTIRDWTPMNPGFREFQLRIASIWAGLIKGTLVYKAEGNLLVMEIKREEWNHYWGDFAEAAHLAGQTWPECSKDGRVDYQCLKDFTDFMFNMMDVNGDGSLDKKEYIKCLAAFGIPENDSEDCYERILLILNRDKTDPSQCQLDEPTFDKLWFEFLTSNDEREAGNYLLGPSPVYS
ncbi:calexcitin-2-like [Lineus longissimus]|uniref:calexcitin-2-like n=1 Tax=Lineus longissimus TaxID=88925 RepID=UPI002B4CF394